MVEVGTSHLRLDTSARAAAVAYADLVWAMYCFSQGEHAAGNDNVIEVPVDKTKAGAAREAVLKHPFGIAITTTPASK